MRPRTAALVLFLVVALAGCNGFQADPGTELNRFVEFSLDNDAVDAYDVEIVVRQVDGPTVHDIETTLPAHFERNGRYNVRPNGTYEITVRRGDGTWSRTATWNSEECDPFRVVVNIDGGGWDHATQCETPADT